MNAALPVNPVLTIAFRDLLKFLRDPARIVSTLIFPAIFIAILGGSLDQNIGDEVGYDFLVFVFTGVFAQTVWQSTAAGIISLIEDRENDFSQEMFVAPISRYAIVFGKILGETSVSMCQALALLPLAVLLGVPLSLEKVIGLLVVALISCLFGGAFGVLVLSRLSSQRAANQIFPFILLPQFFTAGVFAPIKELPWYLEILSRISPLRYAVDLTRSVYYRGEPDASKVVLDGLAFNLAVIAALFVAFLVAGTWLFVRGERNR